MNGLTNSFEQAWELGDKATLDLVDLERYLAHRIEGLLKDNFASLLQTLYRIDYPEKDLPKAFEAPTLAEVASHIARGVLARELQKIETRKQYRKQ